MGILRGACVLLLCLVATLSAAQTPNGSVRGHVTDPNGAVVPGATITASSPSLQGTRVTATNTEGDFVVASLPPGTYKVEVAAPAGSAKVPRTRCSRS